MSKIVVKDTEINIARINDEDYICITDMPIKFGKL